MVNDKWLELMLHTSITHLPSEGSDHCPLLMEIVEKQIIPKKYFEFHNCWFDQPSFLETVSNCWNRNLNGNLMGIFHQKIKRLSSTLSTWSRREFGHIYAKVKDYEEKVRIAEENFINLNSKDNMTILHALNAENIRFLKLEETIPKQKTQLQWFREGDMNSKYFHALIRGRRRKIYIHKIQDEEGNWLQTDNIVITSNISSLGRTILLSRML